jgi:transposase
MDTIIAAPASCKVRAVIHFLHTEGQSAAKVHHQLCRVYGDNVMSNSCVREWCRKFRDGRTDVHDEGGQEQHSTVTEELVQKVEQCLRGKRFTISELSEEFPQTVRTTFYQTVRDRLSYHTFCARWVPKQLTDLAAQLWWHRFFDEGQQKLVSRYDKYLNVDDNYVKN